MNLEVTIIIPTYDRPDRIQRALAYWRQYPVQVIILDGSPERSVSEVALADCPNVSYYHMPVSFEERLFAGASLVTTPYAMFLSDDEFLVFPALVEATQILKACEDVAAVLGSTVMFSLFRGQMVGAPCYASAHHLDIDSESPVGRLSQRLKVPGNVIFYSLTRARILQIACQFIADRRYSCQYVSEYQMEAMFCSAGKVKVMKRVLWLRSMETSPVSFKGWRRSVLFHEWCDDSKNAGDLAYLEKSADKFLSLASDHKEKVSGAYFVENFAKFESSANTAQRPFVKSLSNRGRLLFDLLPKALRHALRTLRGAVRLRPKSPFVELDQVIVKLKHVGVRADEADLMRIKRLVEEIRDY